MDATSEVIAEVQAGTPLHLLSTSVLHDGTRRGCISLEGPLSSSSPCYGWLTTRTSEARPLLQRYGRPVYEVASESLKLRSGSSTDSKFLRQLTRGIRVHIAAMKKINGCIRAYVTVLGSSKTPHGARPVGWITASKGPRITTLVEVQVDGGRSIPMPSQLKLCEPSYKVAPSLEGYKVPRPSSPINPLDSLPSSPTRSPTRRDAFYPINSSRNASPTKRGPLSTRRGSKAGVAPKSHAPAPAAPPSKLASKAKFETTPPASLEPAGDRAGSPAPQRASGAKSNWQSSKDGAMLKQTKESSVILSSTAIQEFRDALLEQANQEEEKLKNSSLRSLTVVLGEILTEKSAKDKHPGRFVEQLVKSWDSSRDGTISLLEFRKSVKLLVPKADTKEVDQLFRTIDADKNGELDLNEMKVAFKQLQKAAKDSAERIKAINEAAEALRAQSAQYLGVVDITREYEAATKALAVAEGKSISAQLGQIIKSKGVKVGDLIQQWGGADGEIDRHEFRREMKALGIGADVHEVDTLFDQIDLDDGGTIDKEELREAFKVLIDEAANSRNKIKELRADAVEKEKASRQAQKEWKRQKVEAEAAAQAELERAALEAESAAKAEAEAKAARQAALAEKQASKEAEKRAFEARINQKRKSVVAMPGGLSSLAAFQAAMLEQAEEEQSPRGEGPPSENAASEEEEPPEDAPPEEQLW